MTVRNDDLAGRIGEIARHILGEPNHRLSTRSTLRFGTRIDREQSIEDKIASVERKLGS